MSSTMDAFLWLAKCAVSAGLVMVASLSSVSGISVQQVERGFTPSAEFSDRFEGLVARQVANHDFELLSFHGAIEPPSGTDDLKIDFYLHDESPAVIYAQELRDDKFYRMITKRLPWSPAAWNTYGPWPVSAVITPRDVSFDNIGVVVMLSGTPELSANIAPAFVYRETRPTSNHYTLAFKLPRTTLRQVHYVLEGPSHATSGTLPGDFIRGTPIMLELDSASLENGLHTLTLDCIPISFGAKPVERTFTFFHAG